jgi:hypothetical protein
VPHKIFSLIKVYMIYRPAMSCIQIWFQSPVLWRMELNKVEFFHLCCSMPFWIA